MQKTSKHINVFDFDHTIYNGDCSLDFYFFSVVRNASILRFLPYQLWHAGLFIFKLESRTKFKSSFFIFLKTINDPDAHVRSFWEQHDRKIKDWYQEIHSNDDVIVSASPEFLLEPIAKELHVKKLLATKMDEKTGVIEGKNCRGLEKARRFQKAFPSTAIQRVYSDSMSDTPLFALAKESYVVKGDTIISLVEFKKMSAIRRYLLR